MNYELNAQDRKRVAEVVEKMTALDAAIKRVMPELPDQERGTLAHNLADFWNIARNHCNRVEAILKMSGADERKQLAELLDDLLYGDVEAELPYHLESMRETLPKVIERLDPST